jgi:rSAM-associated Gly-rich repeat protein
MMNNNQKTWISFIAMLSTLTASQVATGATPEKNITAVSNLEQRLSRIHNTLKNREDELPEDASILETVEDEKIARGWFKGRRRSFLNGRRGGFLNNRRRWGDGRRGFMNW